ncbi:BRO-N domain-containing protein [Caproiciproducens sp.]|uniref:BRO-N domain-containing protein n=1 Tax=Caproiciproducens sp. TaxID=1954376 RepID=UPI003FA4C527
MTDLKIFDNEEFGAIRVIDKSGEPWFVGKDATAALGYANSRKALLDHVDDDDKGVTKRNTLGGAQEITIINESGLYSLIFSSKLPKAKEFKRWVTSEVLPSIRKTGSYSLQEYPTKSTSAGEVASLVKCVDRIAIAKRCSADDRAEIANEICKQFNIVIPECFTQTSLMEQMALIVIH